MLLLIIQFKQLLTLALSIRICLVSSYTPVKGAEATYAKDFVPSLERYFANEITELYVLSHTEGRKCHYLYKTEY
jgi:hypothetical protein